MKDRFRLFRRGWGVFYFEDTETGKQQTLQTTDKREAQRMVHARNEALHTPHVNLMIAKAYLAASDPALTSRTWQQVINAIIESKTGDTRHRWETAAKDHALDRLRDLPLVKSQAEDILDAIKRGTVSTNVYLRRLHNYAWDMNWLVGPVVVRRHWPKIRFREKRAITFEEHRRIIEREGNPERRAFYELCWHLGGSQSDIASLQAEDVDWAAQTISYERRKLKGRGLRPSIVQFGPDVEKLLVTLPAKGPLFPYLITVRANDRATEFGQRCRGLGIVGVTLHSYRYAWAERAGRCGFGSAGFTVGRLQREEAHPIWLAWLTRTTFNLSPDNRKAIRQLRKVLRNGGITIVRDEFNIIDRRGEKLRVVFMLDRGAPGVA